MKTIYVVDSFKDLEVSRKAVQEIERLGCRSLISSPGDPKASTDVLRGLNRQTLSMSLTQEERSVRAYRWTWDLH